jgi:hypothetical protein
VVEWPLEQVHPAPPVAELVHVQVEEDEVGRYPPRAVVVADRVQEHAQVPVGRLGERGFVRLAGGAQVGAFRAWGDGLGLGGARGAAVGGLLGYFIARRQQEKRRVVYSVSDISMQPN